MARIYQQFLLKGKNCKEQIWMKSQLLKRDKDTLKVSDHIEDEIISLEQKFENIYKAYESVIFQKIYDVNFYF